MDFFKKIELIDGGKVYLIATSERLVLETQQGDFITSVYLEGKEIEQLRGLLYEYLQEKELPYGVEE